MSARAAGKSGPHGLIADVLGKAAYDEEQQKFVEFELVALGDRWGRTTYNSRLRDGDSNPLGFVVQLASPDAPRIPPAFIAWGYADWVQHP